MTRLEHTRLADTAICIFDDLVPHFFKDAEPSPWEDWRANYGSAEVRAWCIETAPVVEEAWLLVTQGPAEPMFGGCFDFEFVPLFLRICVQWGKHGQPVVIPGAPETLHNLISLGLES
jgi:hypothetical protein